MKTLPRYSLVSFAFAQFALLVLMLSVVVPVSLLQGADGRPTRTIASDSWLNGPAAEAVLDECYVHTFTLGGAQKRIIVYYTTDSPTASHRIPNVDTTPADGVNDWAFQIAQWAAEAWTTFTGYGFNSSRRTVAGDGVEEVEIWVFNLSGGLAGWCCTGEAFTLEAPIVFTGNEASIEEVIIHELWHSTEYSFEERAGWINEGTAAAMEDHTDAAIDLRAGGDFVGRAMGFLGNPQEQLLLKAYPAALWWKYFMEQIGASTSEPGRGMDAHRAFWRDSGPSGLARLDNVIRARTGDARTLESVWCDFAVANYVKNLTGSVPSRYRYFDESQTPGPYDFDNNPSTPPLARDLDMALTSSGPGAIAVTDIAPWASRYYRFRPATNVPIVTLEFRQDTSFRLCYNLLATRGGDLVIEDREVGRHFVRAIPNVNYDEVVVIVTSYNDAANFRYAVNPASPLLNIIDPLQVRPVNVGPPTAPEKFLAKVEVLTGAGGGTPVAGIDPATFQVTVGSQAATFVSGAYVAGQYWLLMQAPTQTFSGTYNLRVQFTALQDTETNAVAYSTRLDTDNVLVIDRSGSMGSLNKMTSAKNAARLYVDSWRTGDKIGVISFNEDANLASANLTLRDWSSSSRTQAFNLINSLVPSGATSIGDGLFGGLGELDARGDTNHDWALIVLSDGLENRSRFIQEFLDTYNTRMGMTQKVPVVHSIAIGPDANRGRLQDLSARTGGTYLYATEPPTSPSPAGATLAAAPPPPVDLPNDLAEYYRVIAEALERQQQIYSERGMWEVATVDRHFIRVEAGAQEAIFSINWHGFSGPGPITLRRPSGATETAFAAESTHRIFRVSDPPAGTWEVRVEGCSPGTEFCEGRYLVEAAVKSRLTFHLYFAQPLAQRRVGTPITLLATLTDAGPVAGAVVNVEVVVPEYEGPLFVEPAELRTLRLYDDGRHNDGRAGDGIYANDFPFNQRPGSYDVTAVATGSTPLHGAYVRRARAAFDVVSDSDSDADGMPDGWEQARGLNPNSNDRDLDPDMDGLTNWAEYRNGTDPRNSDTDNGGENDGSEVANNRNPLEPSDDCVRPLLGVALLPPDDHYIGDLKQNMFVNASVLQIHTHISHRSLLVMRSTQPASGYQTIYQGPVLKTPFVDAQVQPGVAYYYRVIGVGDQGCRSAVSAAVRVVPRSDPFAPEGHIEINDDARTTDSLKVKLNFHASPDTQFIRVANDASFSGAAWQPFQPEMLWNLPANVRPGSFVYVFVQFLDEAGNMSIPESHGILYTGDGGLKLEMTRSPQLVHLKWDAVNVVLEAAAAPSGPWLEVKNAASPYDSDVSGARLFFRLRSIYQ